MATLAETTGEVRLPFETWSCRWNCGFTRSFSIDPQKANQIIEHPIWGLVTNRQAAHLDMKSHSCWEYAKALNRARAKQHFADQIRKSYAYNT